MRFLLLISTMLLFAFVSSYSQDNQVFIENKGQWADEVLYLSKVNGANVWITKSGVIYDYFQMTEIKDTLLNKHNKTHLDPMLDPRMGDEMPNYSIKGHVIKMELVNANQSPSPSGFNKSETYYNYFIGNDKNKWASNVPLFNEVTVNNIYEDISVKYYFDGSSIRYDYIAEAGADISQIKMNYEGQDDISVSPDGELIIGTSLGEIKHNKIFAYQEIDNEKIEIECRFVENGQNIFNFEMGDYNNVSLQKVWDTLY